jgi:hypothetical protein
VEVRLAVDGEEAKTDVVDFDRQMMIRYLSADYKSAEMLDERSHRARLQALPDDYPHREFTYFQVRYSYPDAAAFVGPRSVLQRAQLGGEWGAGHAEEEGEVDRAGPRYAQPAEAGGDARAFPWAGHEGGAYCDLVSTWPCPTEATLGFFERTPPRETRSAPVSAHVDFASQEMFPSLPPACAVQAASMRAASAVGGHSSDPARDTAGTPASGANMLGTGHTWASVSRNKQHRYRRRHQQRQVRRAPHLDVDSHDEFPALGSGDRPNVHGAALR